MNSVVVTEQAARQLEDMAGWWSHHRSREQAERWYAGIRQIIAGLSNHPERYPRAAESGTFRHELREAYYGLGARPTHRIVFSILKQTVVVLTIRHVAQDRLQPEDL